MRELDPTEFELVAGGRISSIRQYDSTEDMGDGNMDPEVAEYFNTNPPPPTNPTQNTYVVLTSNPSPAGGYLYTTAVWIPGSVTWSSPTGVELSGPIIMPGRWVVMYTDYDMSTGGSDGGSSNDTVLGSTDLPYGVNPNDVINIAQAWYEQYGDEPVEYAALIYLLNGEIRISQTVSQGLPGQVEGMDPSALLPPGARVVGWIHNHPDDADGPGQDTPSFPVYIGQEQVGDWPYVDWLLNGALPDAYAPGTGYNGNIVVDPHLLTFIATSQGLFVWGVEDYYGFWGGEQVHPGGSGGGDGDENAGIE